MTGYVISFWDLFTGVKLDEKEIVFASQQAFFEKLQRCIESIVNNSSITTSADIVYRIEAVL